MEAEEGGQTVFNHKVILIGSPAEEGHGFQEEGEAIWAWERGELFCGAAGLDGVDQVGQAVRVVRGQGSLQGIDGGGGHGWMCSLGWGRGLLQGREDRGGECRAGIYQRGVVWEWGWVAHDAGCAGRWIGYISWASLSGGGA